jgi:isocitrate lyase
MFELARAYKLSGMSAYSRLQEKEFGSAELYGYEAVKHQRFVGTGYFDMVTQVIASGNSSTTALADSTEADQFAPGGGPAETGAESKSRGEEHANVPIIFPEMERTRVRL